MTRKPDNDDDDKSPLDINNLFDRAEETQAATGQSLDEALDDAFAEAQEKSGG